MNVKKISLLAVLLILAAGSSAKAAELAFIRNGEKGGTFIWTYNTETGKEKECTVGYDAEISPDGRKIAFTAYGERAERRVAIYDIEKGTEKKLESEYLTRNMRDKKFEPNDYGPRWSPEGNAIMLNRFVEGSTWTPVIIELNSDGTEGKEFMPAARDGNAAAAKNLFSIFWSADGKSIYGSNLDEIFRFSASPDSSGLPEERIPIDKIVEDKTFVSSATNFTVSPDGKMWLIAIQSGSENCAFCMSSSFAPGAIGALYIYRPEQGTTERVKTGDLCVYDADWLSNDEIVLSAHSTSENKSRGKTTNIFDIYRMKMDGGTPEKIISNGYCVSASFKKEDASSKKEYAPKEKIILNLFVM